MQMYMFVILKCFIIYVYTEFAWFKYNLAAYMCANIYQQLWGNKR